MTFQQALQYHWVKKWVNEQQYFKILQFTWDKYKNTFANALYEPNPIMKLLKTKGSIKREAK